MKVIVDVVAHRDERLSETVEVTVYVADVANKTTAVRHEQTATSA